MTTSSLAEMLSHAVPGPLRHAILEDAARLLEDKADRTKTSKAVPYGYDIGLRDASMIVWNMAWHSSSPRKPIYVTVVAVLALLLVLAFMLGLI